MWSIFSPFKIAMRRYFFFIWYDGRKFSWKSYVLILFFDLAFLGNYTFSFSGCSTYCYLKTDFAFEYLLACLLLIKVDWKLCQTKRGSKPMCLMTFMTISEAVPRPWPNHNVPEGGRGGRGGGRQYHHQSWGGADRGHHTVSPCSPSPAGETDPGAPALYVPCQVGNGNVSEYCQDTTNLE